MKKNISISTCFNYDIPIEEQLDLISKSGFKYVSLGSNTSHSGLFGDRFIAVHLSDRIKEFVHHVVPGEGFIDFEIICNLLKIHRRRE